ncbi:helix-turn-helix domain-containing protein [Microbacterium sp. KSW2-21]|uniref:Helix-turn-helix domain-containing protein n=1 Tax=Microbacterium algihabitans TaxID=3075992 RepID=A0ABU3S071_9MICO|nr:helix-turn-helix domain-containing protein [Microbacterium sp. KSW2-21]MDU0328459.1 helix-turn-helix domain-containing protein [Microbacterium sp. KSW2-21]
MSAVTAADVAVWQDATSERFASIRCVPVSDDFHGVLDTRLFGGGVSVTSVRSSGLTISRSETLLRSAPSDEILLALQVASTGRLRQNDSVAHVETGGGVLFDAGRPYDIDNTAPGQRQLVLRLSRRAIPAASSDIAQACARPLAAGESTLRVLSTMSQTVFDEATELNWESRESLGEALLVTVGALIRATGGQPSRTAQQLREMRRFIEAHLNSDDLGVPQIAAALFVSARTVHEAFAAAGDSPAAYVRRRRTAKAKSLLIDGASVQEAAALSGFKDSSTFIRAFTKEHTQTPAAWRRQQSSGIRSIDSNGADYEAASRSRTA